MSDEFACVLERRYRRAEQKRLCDHGSCSGCSYCLCHLKPKVVKLTDGPKKSEHKPQPLESIAALLPAFQPRKVKARVTELVKAGQRAASFSDGRGSGETPDVVAIRMLRRAEEWQPESEMSPDPVIGLADPTDREILNLDRTIKSELRKAERAVIAALKAQDKLLAKADLAAKREPDPIDDCLSCKRYEPNGKPFFSARADEKSCGEGNVLCTWCDDWLKANGDWPPVEVVAVHAEGKLVTTKVLKELGFEVVAGSKNRVVTIVIPNPEVSACPQPG